MSHLHTLDDASAPVRTVAFSPDTRFLATGSYDSKLRLYRRQMNPAKPLLDVLGVGKKAMPVLDYTDADALGKIFSVAFSPDSKLLASGAEDHLVRVYNIENEVTPKYTLKDAGDSVYTVAFSPDSKLLAAGSADKKVRLYGLGDDGTPVFFHTLEGSKTAGIPVHSVAFSPDSRLLAVGSDAVVRIFVVGANMAPFLKYTIQDTANSVLSVAWSEDRNFFVCGSADKKVRVYRMTTSGEPPLAPTDDPTSMYYDPVSVLL